MLIQIYIFFVGADQISTTGELVDNLSFSCGRMKKSGSTLITTDFVIRSKDNPLWPISNNDGNSLKSQYFPKFPTTPLAANLNEAVNPPPPLFTGNKPLTSIICRIENPADYYGKRTWSSND